LLCNDGLIKYNIVVVLGDFHLLSFLLLLLVIYTDVNVIVVVLLGCCVVLCCWVVLCCVVLCCVVGLCCCVVDYRPYYSRVGILVQLFDGHTVTSISTTHIDIRSYTFDWSNVNISISGDNFVSDNTIKHDVISNLCAVILEYAIKYEVFWNLVFMTKLGGMQFLQFSLEVTRHGDEA